MEFCDSCGSLSRGDSRKEVRSDGLFRVVESECLACGEEWTSEYRLSSVVDAQEDRIGRGVSERENHPLETDD